TREEIARHVVSAEKGRMIKNNHHYRGHSQRIADLEAAIVALLDDGQGVALCQLLQQTSPRIYKDQLVATRSLLCAHPPAGADWWQNLLAHQRLTAQQLQRHLEARAQAQARGRSPADDTPAPWESSATAHTGRRARARRARRAARRAARRGRARAPRRRRRRGGSRVAARRGGGSRPGRARDPPPPPGCSRR